MSEYTVSELDIVQHIYTVTAIDLTEKVKIQEKIIYREGEEEMEYKKIRLFKAIDGEPVKYTPSLDPGLMGRATVAYSEPFLVDFSKIEVYIDKSTSWNGSDNDLVVKLEVSYDSENWFETEEEAIYGEKDIFIAKPRGILARVKAFPRIHNTGEACQGTVHVYVILRGQAEIIEK